MAEKPKGDPPRFALPATLDVTLHTESKAIHSENVAGLIEGSDPKLKDEVVVLSAHLDHIGVTPPVDGDSINNGALDNAAGVATTLEVARAFQESGQKPRRSILFLTVTGEEKGLLGAEYFAHNPTVGRGSLVANVDLDMPILFYDFTDVIAFGSDRSGVGPAVRKAAGRMGVALSPDPLPEEGLFTRSDHFRFVEVGVPAVFLMTGFQNGGEAKFRGFLATCYHRPCDDVSQPIDYAVGAKFARLNYEITRELADAEARPLWVKGDFFGTKFAPKQMIADR
jgi:Zn-dependent M28 family amino/carboxypeptidase